MTEPREVTDAGQLKWSCVQAYGGAHQDLVTDDNGLVPVVCTPSGSAQSVRVELPPSWAESLPDRELIAAIARARSAA
ncbi:MAG TPA: hypothetical protein VGX52_12875 [Burkholderiales bacterium]|nr:hypothetical protein [Burkholderiales bacterium]